MVSTSDAALREAVADSRLNGRAPVQCNSCGVTIAEGETVVARFHRDGYDDTWLVTGRFCPACGPAAVEGPDPFDAEMVVRGAVGSTTDPQSRETVSLLLDPEIVDTVGV